MSKIRGWLGRIFEENDQIVDDQGKPVSSVPVAGKKPLDLKKILMVVVGCFAVGGLLLNIVGSYGDSSEKQSAPAVGKDAKTTGGGADVHTEQAHTQQEADKIAKNNLKDLADGKGAGKNKDRNAQEDDGAQHSGSHVGGGNAAGNSVRARRLSLDRERDQAKTIVVDFTRQAGAPSGTDSSKDGSATPAAAVHSMAPESRLGGDRPKPIDLSEDAEKQPSEKKKEILTKEDKYSGSLYPVYEGTYLEVVVLNRINGDAAGPVVCMLSSDYYWKDQALLIPKGTKLIGDVRSVSQQDQSRLYVAFHLMRMPDGFKVNLDQFKGLSQIGDVGLRDQVNRHLMMAFGASLAIGAVGGLSQIGSGYGTFGYDPGTAIRMGIGQQMGQESIRILDRFLNRLPTIVIREGYPARIYISSDLNVPAYGNHDMGANL